MEWVVLLGPRKGSRESHVSILFFLLGGGWSLRLQPLRLCHSCSEWIFSLPGKLLRKHPDLRTMPRGVSFEIQRPVELAGKVDHHDWHEKLYDKRWITEGIGDKALIGDRERHAHVWCQRLWGWGKALAEDTLSALHTSSYRRLRSSWSWGSSPGSAVFPELTVSRTSEYPLTST